MKIDPMRLKVELARKKLTQKELAKIIGETEASVSRYIHGNRTPRGVALVKIALALDTTPEYLCDIHGLDCSETFARVRGDIAQNISAWTADQKRELLLLLVS